MTKGVNKGRRKFLIGATSVVGAAGVAGAAIPFVLSWMPSARAKAAGAPAMADISKLKPGDMVTIPWRKRPVWILHRTKQQIAELPKLNGRLADPFSKEPQQAPNLPHWNPVQRSIKPEYFVAVGICTHLGCIPTYVPKVGSTSFNANWEGGFHCQCHGSQYDLAGRVYTDQPAPLNLPVPPHYYRSENVIVVGTMENGSEASWTPSIW